MDFQATDVDTESAKGMFTRASVPMNANASCVQAASVKIEDEDSYAINSSRSGFGRRKSIALSLACCFLGALAELDWQNLPRCVLFEAEEEGQDRIVMTKLLRGRRQIGCIDYDVLSGSSPVSVVDVIATWISSTKQTIIFRVYVCTKRATKTCQLYICIVEVERKTRIMEVGGGRWKSL